MTSQEFLDLFAGQPYSEFNPVALRLMNRELAVQMLEDQLKTCHDGGLHLAAKLLETQRELSRVIRKGKR